MGIKVSQTAMYIFKNIKMLTTVLTLTLCKSFSEHQIVLESFLEDHVTLKTEVMLKTGFCHHRNILHFKIY